MTTISCLNCGYSFMIDALPRSSIDVAASKSSYLLNFLEWHHLLDISSVCCGLVRWVTGKSTESNYYNSLNAKLESLESAIWEDANCLSEIGRSRSVEVHYQCGDCLMNFCNQGHCCLQVPDYYCSDGVDCLLSVRLRTSYVSLKQMIPRSLSIYQRSL